MSHHYSGPDFGFPRGDARLDFTDLYAFPKPGDPRKSILVMNVHPSAVVTPPGPTTDEPFAPEALYEFKIDTNGDAIADIAYRVRFSASEDGTQSATLRRVEGAQAAGTDDSGRVIVASAQVSMGRDARVTEAGDYRFFAGWRSDPFFFDVHGMVNNQQFTGDDFFADKDVCSIVLEVPNSDLGTRRVGLWARTLIAEPGAGSRSIAARCPHKLSSSSAKKETHTSQVSRPTMLVSFLSLRTRWSMRVGTRKKKQGRWPARCCQR